MKILPWIVLGIIGLYLLLVIPAGIAVWISELRFRRSPHRQDILALIERYKQQIRASNDDAWQRLLAVGSAKN